MKTKSILQVSMIASALAVLAVSAPALAQERYEVTGPNRHLLRSGIWTLGLSYVPAVVVAAESDHPGDDNLYLPVVGPWMDLANRGGCTVLNPCDHENLNKALIVTDGIFQGLGALQILGSFIFIETRTRVAASEPKKKTANATQLQIAPSFSPHSYGLVAVGKF
jgi:hypothetical protein